MCYRVRETTRSQSTDSNLPAGTVCANEKQAKEGAGRQAVDIRTHISRGDLWSRGREGGREEEEV